MELSNDKYLRKVDTRVNIFVIKNHFLYIIIFYIIKKIRDNRIIRY